MSTPLNLATILVNFLEFNFAGSSFVLGPVRPDIWADNAFCWNKYVERHERRLRDEFAKNNLISQIGLNIGAK